MIPVRCFIILYTTATNTYYLPHVITVGIYSSYLLYVFIVGNLLYVITVGYLQSAVTVCNYCMLFIIHYLLYIVFLLFSAYYLPFTIYIFIHTIYSLLFY